MSEPFSRPILCYVTDRRSFANSGDLTGCIALAASAGVSWIQIREKDLSARELLVLVSSAVKIAAQESVPNSPARVLVNDRLDVAVAALADGVHLAETSVPVVSVNKWRHSSVSYNELLVGASCHSLEGAEAAEKDGADYVFFGPVFTTPSKAEFGPPQGIRRLEAVTSTVKIPVLAIGGITAENAGECLAAGAAGVAAIRMFQESNDLQVLVKRLRGNA